MLDILLSIGVVAGLGLGGVATKMALDARAAAAVLRSALDASQGNIILLDAKVRDLQSILTAAPPDMIAASVIADQWKSEMLALPEGSPKRQAYESRLKQLGVS